MAWRILVPRPGIKPMPPALEAQSLNHWDFPQRLGLKKSATKTPNLTGLQAFALGPFSVYAVTPVSPWPAGSESQVLCTRWYAAMRSHDSTWSQERPGLIKHVGKILVSGNIAVYGHR